MGEGCEDVPEEGKGKEQTNLGNKQGKEPTPAVRPVSDGRSSHHPRCSGRRGLLSLLCRLIADVMLIGVVLSTVLGVVQNSGQEVLQPPAKPVPFFTRTSHHGVTDYFRGDVFRAFSDAGQYENSLFMFYAPWDRASQEARQTLIEVAAFFKHTDILVAAVNCWFPTSDCAKEFGNKSLATPFPVLIFYPGQQGGVQYRGPLRADLIVRWVQDCRYPLTHLQSAGHLSLLQVTQPSVLVAFLPQTSPTSLDPAHVPLLRTALALLEVHPDRALGVAVTTEPALARTLRLGVSQPVRLVTWNNTVAFPNKTIDSDKLLNWALRHNSQVVPWLRLPRRKSMVLQKSLGDQALVVFSQRDGLAPLSETASVIRRVAAAYNDCESLPAVASYREALAAGGWGDQAECDVDVKHCQSKQECKLHSWAEGGSVPPSACTAVPSNVTTCEGEGVGWDEEVIQLIKEDRGEKAQSPTLASWNLSEAHSNVTGLACDSNRSLNMILADTVLHSALLGALGLPQGWEGGVIVSPGEETVAPGEAGGLAEEQLEALVSNWHRQGEALGKPGLRSSEAEGCPPAELNQPISCIPRLNSATFQALVDDREPSRGAVVFYTSTFCAHCTAASFVVHTVQQLLEPLGDLGLSFYIIDATTNDLPVYLTALSFPTVLVFPSHSKAESRVFPVKEEFNTTNLLTFIVSNLPPSIRLRLALSTCSSSCLSRLRLDASSALGRLASIARRRPSVIGRRAYQRRLRYNKTVLYVITAWVDDQSLPRVGEDFVTAILESFKEATVTR